MEKSDVSFTQGLHTVTPRGVARTGKQDGIAEIGLSGLINLLNFHRARAVQWELLTICSGRV